MSKKITSFSDAVTLTFDLRPWKVNQVRTLSLPMCIPNLRTISYSIQIQLMLQNTTRTTRMPAFWGYTPPPPPPPPPQWLPILFIHIGSQVKTRQSQSYKFKEFAKTLNLWILNKTLHATHLLELLDKRWIWNGSGNIVEDTKQTRFCTQTDKGKPVYPFQILWAGGIIMFWWLSGKTNAITPITHSPS